MLDTIPQCTVLHTLKFVDLVHDFQDVVRRLPIVSMDAYKITEASDFLLNKSFGKYSHHFILAEIGTDPPTFARVDFQGDQPLGEQPIAQSIMLSAERASLTPGCTSFARLANPNPGGMTLDAFAGLLQIMHRRTHKYDVFSRNCLWMAECILYATGRRYTDHWRAGNIDPLPLGRYVDGSIGATTATAELCTGDPVGRFFVDASLQVLKGCQWLFSLPAGDKRIRYPDEEIWEIIGEWRSLGAL